MAMMACGLEFYIALTERGGLVVQGMNDNGQLGISTAQDEVWHPVVLGGLGPVVGDEVANIVGGVHALALSAAFGPDEQLAVGPGVVLAHPLEGKVAMVAAGRHHARTTHDARTCTLMPNKSVALSANACQVSLH